MQLIIAAIAVYLQIVLICCSHFRGSMITWRVINESSNPLVVEILQRHAWNYTWWPCTNPQIIANNYMIGTGNLVCASPCPWNASTIGAVTVPCTGFNQIERYVSGEGRLTVSVPVNTTFRAVFTGSAWFGLVTGGGTWSVATEIRTFRRSNGRYNNAPVATMLPIIRLRQFNSYQIKINVADNDFDRYTCIWSNTSQECGGVCRSALTLPASTFLNTTSCVLYFTPVNIGFYAMAFTVLDFENATSTSPLSRVPIQFIFNVWTSNITCNLPPLYIGDAPADQCIFVEPGQFLTVLIRIRIRCPNATLANVIGVYPKGFTQSSPYLDPFDPTVNVFLVNYTASANQVGQNLFCFAGVDSVGNQGDSTCLRFTVQISSDSQNTLYLNNATRFPMGLVSKYQSVWTLMYPTGLSFTRPSTFAYIHFKVTSTQVDYVKYNVVTQVDNVDYRSDRLVITSNVIFQPGEQYFIALDPGVFLPIGTCLRDSMGITVDSFWPFQTPTEPSSTLTTSTTSQSSTTTILNRTVPTIRTISTTLPTSTIKKTTEVLSTSTSLSTTLRSITPSSAFPISGAVGITIGCSVLLGALFTFLFCLIRRYQTKPNVKTVKIPSVSDTEQQYQLKTRRAVQPSSRGPKVDMRDAAQLVAEVKKTLITTDH